MQTHSLLWKARGLLVASASLLAFAGAATGPRKVSAQEAGPVRPDVSRATLSVGARTLQPVRIRQRWDDRQRSGDAGTKTVLIGVDGHLQQSEVDRLLDERDDRPISLLE